MFAQRKGWFRPRLEALENRIAPAVSVTGSFSGIGNTGWTPPNPGAAAGPNYVVETVNESVAIFSKATGTQVSQETLQTLFSGFANGSVNDPGMFDPFVLYDDLAGRFVVGAQVRDSTNPVARIPKPAAPQAPTAAPSWVSAPWASSAAPLDRTSAV